MADYSLVVNVEAIDKASTVFNKIQGNVNTFKSQVEGVGTAGTNSMDQLGTSMQNMGGKMASTGRLMTATVTTPVLGLGTAAVKVTADFDSAMSKVSAVSGATGKDLQDLRDKAREMGAKTKFSASEAAEAMNYMAMAGWKTGDMMNGIEGIMNLAAASGEDLATTSDIVTDALTAMGLSASDSGHFADILAAASSNANTNVAMMGETFKYCAPVAGALGFSAEDTAEAIGLMANAGIKSSQAGTAMRTMLTSLTGDVTVVGDAFGELTIQTVNTDGSMRSLGDILTDCRTAFSQMSDSEKAANAEALVGKNAMSGFLAVMNAAPGDVTKLHDAISTCSDEMDGYNGTCEKMAAVMQDNLEGQLTILKSQLQELAISVGESLVPVVRDAVTILQGVVNAFNSLSPGTKEAIVRILAITAAVGPLLWIGGKLIGGIGKLISLGSKVGGLIGGIGSSAGAAVGPVAGAGKAVGTLSSNALGFIALGAGILLAAAGLALLAQSAIAIAGAGPEAAVALAGLVVALALMAAGAAALAPALTAGAVGLVAFGAGLVLVGVGILAASAGMTLLATQLPTISEYGMSAAGAIAVLGVSMISYAGGATLAGGASAILAAGLVVLAAGMVAAGAGAVVAAAGVTLFGAGVMVLSAGVIVLGAGVLALGSGLTLCGAGLVLIAGNATTAAVGFAALTVATTAAFVPIVAGAASTLTLDVALIGLTATLALSTAGAVALDVAMLALAAEMVTIAGSANTAATDLKTMVTAVKVVETGLSSLKTIAQQAVKDFVGAFSSGVPSAKSTAQTMSTAVTNAVKLGLNPIPANTNATLSQMNRNATTNFSRMNQSVSSQMSRALSTVQRNIRQMEAAFRGARFSFSQHISVPHFSMSGSFNAQTGATPSVSVQWYRKAYDQAMMFNTPTVFGASGMGFGDGNGTEIVTGDQHLMDMMRDVMTDMGGNIVIPVYVGQERIDELVVTAQQRTNFRSGGR